MTILYGAMDLVISSTIYKMRCLIILAILIFSSPAWKDARADINTWSANGGPGGTIMAMAIHPANNSTVFAGSVSGKGIYCSTNAGERWNTLEGSAIINNSIRKIVIHPVGPDTIFVSTVLGMYVSRDNGLNWDLMIPPGNQNDDFRGLLVHPHYPNIIFAGSAFGQRIKSIDGGRNWYEINTAGRTVGVDDICNDPNNDSILYFVSGSMSVGLGVWKTTDMGENWFTIQNNMDSSGTGEAIVVDRANSSIL